MRVVIVCTGNVARSPALALLLSDLRPDLDVSSAAVGLKAKQGRRCARNMRLLLAEAGHVEAAENHRSRLYIDLPERPDVVVACAPIHVKRLAAVDPEANVMECSPPIPDPAFGGMDSYLSAWPLLVKAAHHFAHIIPGAPR